MEAEGVLFGHRHTKEGRNYIYCCWPHLALSSRLFTTHYLRTNTKGKRICLVENLVLPAKETYADGRLPAGLTMKYVSLSENLEVQGSNARGQDR